MPIKFAVKIVRLKVYMTIAQSDVLDLHSRSQVRQKLDFFLTCNIQTWNDGRLTGAIYALSRFDDLDLDSM